MKGVEPRRGLVACLSGEALRKGRWHVGQSEKEGAPRRISCWVWGSRMTIASLWRLEEALSVSTSLTLRFANWAGSQKEPWEVQSTHRTISRLSRDEYGTSDMRSSGTEKKAKKHFEAGGFTSPRHDIFVKGSSGGGVYCGGMENAKGRRCLP